MSESVSTTINTYVTGMTCGHCVNHVTEELSEVPGISRVTVLLNTEGVSNISIFTDGDVSDEAIREAIAEAGDYNVIEIAR